MREREGCVRGSFLIRRLPLKPFQGILYLKKEPPQIFCDGFLFFLKLPAPDKIVDGNVIIL